MTCGNFYLNSILSFTQTERGIHEGWNLGNHRIFSFLHCWAWQHWCFLIQPWATNPSVTLIYLISDACRSHLPMQNVCFFFIAIFIWWKARIRPDQVFLSNSLPIVSYVKPVPSHSPLEWMRFWTNTLACPLVFPFWQSLVSLRQPFIFSSIIKFLPKQK